MLLNRVHSLMQAYFHLVGEPKGLQECWNDCQAQQWFTIACSAWEALSWRETESLP